MKPTPNGAGKRDAGHRRPPSRAANCHCAPDASQLPYRIYCAPTSELGKTDLFHRESRATWRFRLGAHFFSFSPALPSSFFGSSFDSPPSELLCWYACCVTFHDNSCKSLVFVFNSSGSVTSPVELARTASIFFLSSSASAELILSFSSDSCFSTW